MESHREQEALEALWVQPVVELGLENRCRPGAVVGIAAIVQSLRVVDRGEQEERSPVGFRNLPEQHRADPCDRAPMPRAVDVGVSRDGGRQRLGLHCKFDEGGRHPVRLTETTRTRYAEPAGCSAPLGGHRVVRLTLK